MDPLLGPFLRIRGKTACRFAKPSEGERGLKISLPGGRVGRQGRWSESSIGLGARSPRIPSKVGEVGEHVSDVLVAQRGVWKHSAPRMSFAYGSKAGFVVF